MYLMKTYVPYVFRAKRLTQTLYLMFFCSYVLMFTALAAARAHLGNKNKRACFVLLSVCTIFAQVSYNDLILNTRL